MANPRISKITVSDIPAILKLLETKSYAQVACIYGYESALSTGGSAIRKFLEKNGYNPKDYNKPKAKPKQKEYGHIGGVFTSPEHFIITTYVENGLTIKRYESKLRWNS